MQHKIKKRAILQPFVVKLLVFLVFQTTIKIKIVLV